MVELPGIIILGIIAQRFAWRLKLPAILPLILIGLSPGEGLYYFVSLVISIIFSREALR